MTSFDWSRYSPSRPNAFRHEVVLDYDIVFSGALVNGVKVIDHYEPHRKENADALHSHSLIVEA